MSADDGILQPWRDWPNDGPGYRWILCVPCQWKWLEEEADEAVAHVADCHPESVRVPEVEEFDDYGPWP